MGKEYGDAKADWGKTRDERIRAVTLRRFGLEDTRTHETGFEICEIHFVEESTEEMVTLYRSLIGSIGYAAVKVRFDVSYALNVLSMHLSRPNARLIGEGKRIVRDLRTWESHGASLRRIWKVASACLISGFANVLFASVHGSLGMCKLTHRSHLGYTAFLNHVIISWNSKLQSIVTLSSAESESVALCDLTCEVRGEVFATACKRAGI
jgi:hypothetical protein